jgi:hypothetical protein
MTSKEIKSLKRGFGDIESRIEKEQLWYRIIDGIWEIAYQLAVLNERQGNDNT